MYTSTFTAATATKCRIRQVCKGQHHHSKQLHFDVDALEAIQQATNLV